VGVLAALVFIGIVVAAMLKNTGSQSAASRGYGSSFEMSGTASNGIVATETYMQSEDPVIRALAIAKLQDIVDFNNGKTTDPTKQQPFIFGNNNQKRELAKGRYFRSRLLYFNENTLRATFEVESGKSGRGKSMKKARAFYLVEVGMEGKPKWSGLNTMMLGANNEYAGGDIVVKGHATFLDKYAMASTGAGFKFLPDDKTGEGSVFFNKEVKIEKKAEFQVPVFFNDNAIIKNHGTQTVFHNGAGFNKHISTDNDVSTIKVKGDVWVKEGFRTVNYSNNPGADGLTGAQGIKTYFEGVDTVPSNFFYTDKFPLLNADGSFNGSPCQTGGYAEWECQQFSFNSTTYPNMNYNAATNQSNFSTADILEGLNMTAEAEIAKNNPSNSDAVAQSRIQDEPDLSPTNITNAGKQFLTLRDLEPDRAGPDGSISNLSITDVNNWYTKFPASQYPQYYSEGHLLVQVNGKINFADPTTNTFDNKIAFVLENGGEISGKYFNSSIGENSNASTLIYVGETGRLNEFGTYGDFRGLIYVDEKNNNPNQQNTFKWGPDSHIDGAVLLKGKGRINWMEGKATLTKNDEVLAGYADFITPKPGQNTQGKTVTLVPNKSRVGLIPLGYYYNLK